MPLRTFSLILFEFYHSVFNRVTTPDITTLGFTDLDYTLIPQFVNYAHNHVILHDGIPNLKAYALRRMSSQCSPSVATQALDGFHPIFRPPRIERLLQRL